MSRKWEEALCHLIHTYQSCTSTIYSKQEVKRWQHAVTQPLLGEPLSCTYILYKIHEAQTETGMHRISTISTRARIFNCSCNNYQMSQRQKFHLLGPSAWQEKVSKLRAHAVHELCKQHISTLGNGSSSEDDWRKACVATCFTISESVSARAWLDSHIFPLCVHLFCSKCWRNADRRCGHVTVALGRVSLFFFILRWCLGAMFTPGLLSSCDLMMVLSSPFAKFVARRTLCLPSGRQAWYGRC